MNKIQLERIEAAQKFGIIGGIAPHGTSLNLIAREVHSLARSKGWHEQDGKDDGRYLTRAIALMVTELGELFEAYRSGELNEKCDKSEHMVAAGCEPLTNLEEEMADIIIRALDMAARLGVDIGRAVEVKHRFNCTRPQRHGGKLA